MNKKILSVASLTAIAGITQANAQQTGAAASASPDKNACCATEANCPNGNCGTHKPNVVVILADDLGFGDVGFHGAKTIPTPRLDSLAANGVRFTNGYATSATSTPSRYALMTGMYPWKNKDAKILPGDAPLLINVDNYTMPQMMQQAGYTTGAIGKWHLGMGEGNPNWNDTIRPGAKEVGFDYSCIIAATNDRVPTVFVENGVVVGLDQDDPIYVDYDNNFEGEPTALTNPEMLKMEWSHGHNNSIVNGIPRIGYMKGGQNAKWVDEEMADYFVDKVKGFIDDNKNNPFFLYYGLHQPHVPRAPHPRFAGATELGPRGDVIVEADWCVGEVVDYLDSLNLLDNTMIIFSSDNGPVLDDGYKDNARELKGEHSPTGPLRGGKYSLYDGGTRVPFFVYWKGKVQPMESEALICQMDLAASLAELAGAELPDGLDSRNYLPVFLGQSQEGRDALVFEAQGRLGLRQGDWIMMPPYKGPQTNATGNELGNLKDFALFNIVEDPGQQNDVAATNPEKLEELKGVFMEIVGEYYDKTPKPEPLK